MQPTHLVGLLALLLGACSSDGGSSGSNGDGDGTVSLDDLPTGPGWSVDGFCEAWTSQAEEWCSWSETCCGEAASRYSLVGNCRYTKDDCLEGVAAGLQTETAAWDGTVAEQCIQAVLGSAPPAACDGAHVGDRDFWPTQFSTLFLGVIPECRLLIRGTKQLGDSCGWDFECEAGLQCATRSGDPKEGEYECVPHQADGGGCVFDENCQVGSYCIGQLPGVCGSGDAGAPCEEDRDCDSGLKCQGGRAFDPGTCTAAVPMGGDCSGAPCADGSWCSEGVCVIGQEDGSPCGDDQQCLGVCIDSVCTSICGGAYY